MSASPFCQQMVGGKVKKPGKRGRKPAKIDLKAKLERSRQSARECRARKKLRYQYLEELVSSKERAICALREELEMVGSSRSPCSVTSQSKVRQRLHRCASLHHHQIRSSDEDKDLNTEIQPSQGFSLIVLIFLFSLISKHIRASNVLWLMSL